MSSFASSSSSSSSSSTTSTLLVGHTSNVWCSSFSRDASCIATGSSDETLRVWTLLPDLVRGEELSCLNGHGGVVRGCDYSPDSTLLAACSWDQSIYLYNSSDFMLWSKLVGHKYGVSCVKFSPCGRVLASCSWDDTIGIWDLQTGTLLSWFRDHSSPVASCEFIDGGSVLASCSWDGTIKLWSLQQSPQAVLTMKGHPDVVFDISASPSDPNLLLSCGRKKALILWDIRSLAPLQALEKSWMESSCVCFSPSGTHFVTGDNMGELYLWDMSAVKRSSLNAVQASPSPLQAHAAGVTGVSFSRDGALLASCSSDYTCRVWDAKHSFEAASLAALSNSLQAGLTFGGKD